MAAAPNIKVTIEVVTKTRTTDESLEAELIQTRRGRANAAYEAALMKSKLDRIKAITNPISIHPDMSILNLIARVNDILSEQ